MILASPWALVGLAALPVLWWLHRRRRKPPVRELPSLMFLLEEDELRSLPRGRRLDVELVLALAAAALLALAAADPRIERGGARTVARVVADDVVARDRSPALRDVLAGIRAAADEIVVVREPQGATGAWRRADEAALLAAARAGEASARYVVSDRLPSREPDDVQWIAIGDPDAVNQGIVAVSVRSAGDRLELFVNVLNDAPDPVALSVRSAPGGSARLEVPAGEARPVRMAVAPAERIEVQLTAPDGARHRDANARDDGVVLTRAPVAVHVDPELPARLRARVDAALLASRTRDGIREAASPADAALAVVRRGHPVAAGAGRWVLEVDPRAGDAAGSRAVGADEIGRGPGLRDLSTAGVDWVHPEGPRVPGPGERVVLARRGAVVWPVLTQAGERLRLVPDPLRGSPAPVDTPFWPLLIDNLLALVDGGETVGAGFRAQGVLDADTSRPGRAVRPFDPQRLASAPALARTSPRALRFLLVLGGLACLGLLWLVPALRRRPAGVPRGVGASAAARS